MKITDETDEPLIAGSMFLQLLCQHITQPEVSRSDARLISGFNGNRLSIVRRLHGDIGVTRGGHGTSPNGDASGRLAEEVHRVLVLVDSELVGVDEFSPRFDNIGPN
jgi:hypothetical protein